MKIIVDQIFERYMWISLFSHVVAGWMRVTLSNVKTSFSREFNKVCLNFQNTNFVEYFSFNKSFSIVCVFEAWASANLTSLHITGSNY